MSRCCIAIATVSLIASTASGVERWGMFEAALNGPSEGNPFVDVQVSAEFRFANRTVTADGFYDGNGVYKIRFMPDEPGGWSYATKSNAPELNGKTGRFVCSPVSTKSNHGPVSVSRVFHFAYADGTPYYPVGTTAYAWIHQGDSLEMQTLSTLAKSPFNKMRMCIFPKHYDWNHNDPVFLPFEGSGFNHFNPEFFRHLERRVADLEGLGIEADLILFHPYDRWGFARMPAEADDRYLRYVIARLAAYRNVWWSLANEYDFMREKTMQDWDRFFRIVTDSDPYHHLRSIHNSGPMYDHTKPWVTHVSVQSSDLDKTRDWLQAYQKPVLFDECKYEGNIPFRWGNISARELVRRFWLAAAMGAYAGHGETYLDASDILWWSKGGVLKGESAPRIAFLRKIMEEGPPGWMNPLTDRYYPAAGKPGEYYLFYFDLAQPARHDFSLQTGVQYRAEIIDPWEMTITPVDGVFEGKFTLPLPGRPQMAVRFRKR
jgi:hypothetical protein